MNGTNVEGWGTAGGTRWVAAASLWCIAAALGCGGGGGGETDAGSSAPDAGTSPADAGTGDAGGREDGGSSEPDAGMTDDAGMDDAGMVPDDAGMMECPTGMAGPTCEECATDYVEFAGECMPTCDAAEAIDCGDYGTCAMSPADGQLFCQCGEGYMGATCDTCERGYELDRGMCVLDLPPSMNLRVWLDADAAGTVSVSSGAVSAWRDRRPAGDPELTQTVGTARPMLVADARNGRDTIRFDGGDQLFVNSSFALSTDDYEIIAAVAPGGGATEGVVSFASSTTTWAVMLDAVGDDYRLTHRRPAGMAGGLTALVERNTSAGAGWVSATHQSSGANDSIALFASDRPADATNVALAASAGIGESMTLRIGRTQGGFLDGDVYEVLIYTRRLTVAEREEVTDYLSAKWDLEPR